VIPPVTNTTRVLILRSSVGPPETRSALLVAKLSIPTRRQKVLERDMAYSSEASNEASRHLRHLPWSAVI
jgi:hypothetical protein